MTKKKKSYDDELPPEGLWISPSGKRINVVEHLASIYSYPHKFLLRGEDVEPFSIENLVTIAESLINSGWIRYRYLAGTHAFEVDNAKKRIDIIERN